MYDLYDLLIEHASPEERERYHKPTLPCRRWNKVTTVDTTAEITAINNALVIYKVKGIKARKRIDYDQTKRFNMKMYKIEIFIENNFDNKK